MATVPGLHRCGLLTPVVTGADFLAIFCELSCFDFLTCSFSDFLALAFDLGILIIIFIIAFSTAK